ncbi:zinc finger CCCH domain-containing protein 48-like isoform X2 [Fagus crenata]
MELRFLKEATSSIQVVVMELSGFGTAILVNVINLGGEVGSVCSEGPWVFVGMPNVVKVWNTESGAEYSLNGSIGQVNALTVVKDLLFAGIEDSVILAWKGTNETNVTFQGHYFTQKLKPMGLGQSGQYRSGGRFGLVRRMKHFGTGQYRCTVSSLPLYIYY